jgi:Ca2+-binding RTX toxin-like protein
LNIRGNGLANVLTGNSAANTLDGGKGEDTLIGGLGDDIYLVDVTTDTIVEAESEGHDTVKSSGQSYTLGANLEDLMLVAATAIYGTGNELANVITGNSSGNVLSGLLGNDTLYGRAGNDTLSGGDGDDLLFGGLGKDILTGGAGADQFIFDTKLGTLTNTDRITDFTPNEDKIALDATIFAALAAIGVVGDGNLVLGSRALDEDDYILYAGGKLAYDSDGSGSTQAVEFGTLVGVPAISASDFMLL